MPGRHGGGTAVGTKVELWDCNGGGNQVWQQQASGSLLNPQSGLCLDSPGGSTANGTQLQIYTCNGTPAQQFALGYRTTGRKVALRPPVAPPPPS